MRRSKERLWVWEDQVNSGWRKIEGNEKKRTDGILFIKSSFWRYCPTHAQSLTRKRNDRARTKFLFFFGIFGLEIWDFRPQHPSCLVFFIFLFEFFMHAQQGRCWPQSLSNDTHTLWWHTQSVTTHTLCGAPCMEPAKRLSLAQHPLWSQLALEARGTALRSSVLATYPTCSISWVR